MQPNKRVMIYDNIIVDNFFWFLAQKGITQKKYADDNTMAESLLSKWKSGDSSPTLDQVIRAAQYFSITVNDLVYSPIEKKKLEVLADKSYDPIIAQQSLKVKRYGDIFKKPHQAIVLASFLYVVVFFTVYLLLRSSPYYSLTILFCIPIADRLLHKSSYVEKTYIINYLDDVFYRRNNTENKHYKWSLGIRVLSLLAVLFYLTLFIGITSMDEIQRALLTVLLIIIMTMIFSGIVAVMELPKKFKKEIYDFEITGYAASRFFLMVHFAILTIAILLCIVEFDKYLAFLICSTIMFGINMYDFYKTSHKYSEYVLVYQESDSAPRALYPKK